jgi:hypothetical protein
MRAAQDLPAQRVSAASGGGRFRPTAFFHQLVPDLGALWAETEVSAPVAGIPRLHLASHIDNILSIGPGKPLVSEKMGEFLLL